MIMKFTKQCLLSLLIVGSIGGAVFSVASPVNVSAAACESSFLGLPAWYRGLALDDKCNPKSPSGDGVSKFIWQIVLNVIDMGFRLITFVALFFILYGGFTFITSNGSADKVAKGKNMLLNAVVGLIICIAASGIISLVTSMMK